MKRAPAQRRKAEPAPVTRPAPSRRRLWPGWPAVVVGALVAWTLLFVVLAPSLPDTDTLFAEARGADVTLLASDGSVLVRRPVEGRAYVPLDAIDPEIVDAVLAVEDRRFYDHFGLDLIGIGRAILANLKAGDVVAGGSTLTQQLVKNLYLTPERSFKRKLDELVLALWLEARLSKDQILELYLNRVYFGSGAYGVEAAARRYFDKDAADVTLPEAAMLAGLLKAPSYYAPTNDIERARARSAVVLAAMQAAGKIDATARGWALAAPARLANPKGQIAGDFVAWTLDSLNASLGKPEGDRTVRTTLDPRLQNAAEAAVKERLANHPDLEAALVVLDHSGAVRAMVGGRPGESDPFNRAVAAHRQPGSAFKAFVYAAAIEAGMTPDAPVSAAPVTVDGWTARNAGDKTYGEVTLETAFAHSLNTVSVRLAQAVGVEEVAALARRLGIKSDLRALPSLALGTSEVTPIELTEAYLPFLADGMRRPAFGVVAVEDEGEDDRFAHADVEAPVLTPEAAAAMRRLLRATVERATGRRAALPDRAVYGKTGTTQANRDAWFVGFTDAHVVGVWVGRDDAAPMHGVNGANLPAYIFADTLRAAPKNPAVASLHPSPRPAADGKSRYALHMLQRWWRDTFGR